MKSYQLLISTLFMYNSISSSNGFMIPKALPTINNKITKKTTPSSSLEMSFLTPPPLTAPLATTSFESLTSILLSDEVTETLSTTTDSGNGWFGFLTGPIEFLLQVFHQMLNTVGLNENAWGVSIVLMTIAIKLVTYPLTKQQLESTSKMQEMQPVIKSIQATYASNPEVMNQKISEVYQSEGVNPLAGCLPAFIQLPVFIGLYRAVLTLAKENQLDESFLWLPSLEGPTYGADPTSGSDWILKGWENGVPTLGWEDTIAFLTIPVFLVISQFISQQLMQPKTQDAQQQEANAFLKFLPLLIGWFSLNVPSALGIYWVANNIFTTLLTLQIRGSIEAAKSTSGGGGVGTAVMEPPKTTTTYTPFEPERTPKPAGFGSSSITDDDGVKPITTPIDAEIIEETKEVVEATTTEVISKSQQKKRGKGKKKRRKN